MRLALILLVLILILPTLLRLVFKVVHLLVQAGPKPAGSVRPTDVPLQGHLKKDPVCGTYISTDLSVKKTVNGEVVHFCSEACRDKFPG